MDGAVNKQIIELEYKTSDHEKRISKLEETTEILRNMDYRMGNVENSVDKINQKLDESQQTKEKDIKGWITFVLQGILTIFLGYIAFKLGLK